MQFARNDPKFLASVLYVEKPTTPEEPDFEAYHFDTIYQDYRYHHLENEVQVNFDSLLPPDHPLMCNDDAVCHVQTLRFVIGMSALEDFEDYHFRDASSVPISAVEWESTMGKWRLYELMHVLKRRYYEFEWRKRDFAELKDGEVKEIIRMMEAEYLTKERARAEANSYVAWQPRTFRALPPHFDNPCTVPAGYTLQQVMEIKPNKEMQAILRDDALQEPHFILDSTAGLEYYIDPTRIHDSAITNTICLKKLGSLRTIRLLHVRIIEDTVKYTDGPPFRNRLETAEKHDPVRHYWEFHNPFSRIIHRDLPTALQGFRVCCLHLDAPDARFPYPVTIPTNPFLYQREDEFLYFATQLFHDLGHTRMANGLREIRSRSFYCEEEVRMFMEKNLLDSLAWFDPMGIRRATRASCKY